MTLAAFVTVGLITVLLFAAYELYLTYKPTVEVDIDG
jgi:hypothetical protein